MFFEIFNSFFKYGNIGNMEFRNRNSSIVFDRIERRNQYNSIRLNISNSTFDIQKFFCSQVRTKSRFRHNKIRQLLTKFGCNDAITTMCNICKRTTMNQTWCIFKCLYEIWFDSIFEKCRKTSFYTKILDLKRFSVNIISKNNISEAFF